MVTKMRTFRLQEGTPLQGGPCGAKCPLQGQVLG